MELFCEFYNLLKAVNYFRKKVPNFLFVWPAALLKQEIPSEEAFKVVFQ